MRPILATARIQASAALRRASFRGAAAALLAMILGGATAAGAGCVAILGDFGGEDLGATTAATGSAAGGGGAGQGSGGGGAGGAGIGGAGGAGGGAASCPSTGRGPEMAKVPGPTGDDYCIDSTEVSVAQYDAWLKTMPDTNGQIPVCTPWNATWTPPTFGNYCEYFDYPQTLTDAPNRPMQCVDWCDAYAFCAWAGKRLCGKIGGGTNPSGSTTDPTASQWYRACSEAGARDFPYGDTFDPKACVGVAFDGDPALDPMKDFPHDVGTVMTCLGGYPGIFDMSGNVWEWEDSCNGSTGKDDGCETRSGGFSEQEPDIRCDNSDTWSRETAAYHIGFRCCADL
jgi:formylglycine-generating enzyme required for sulfatase activity